MDETAVAEQVETPQEPEVAETPAPASLEGEAAPEVDENRLGAVRELFKGATVAELRAALDDVPPEVRSELETEIERRGEQRAQTRKRETDQAKTDRLALWKPLADDYGRAEASLRTAYQRAKAGDVEALSDPDALLRAIDAYRNGAVGQIVIENEAYVNPLVDKLLPDMTPEEQQKLDKPLYQFAQTGLASHVMPVLTELAMERARKEGFEEGVKKGQQNRQAQASLAEKLAKIEEIRKQAPGVTVNGKPVSREDERSALQREIDEFDPTKMPRHEAEARLADLRQKMRSV